MTKTTAQESNAFMELFDLKLYQEGILSGLSFAAKDCIDIAGHRTGCGNPTYLKSRPPSPASALCINQLLANGAICKGKTISDEITFSLDGENAHYGTPLNPKAQDRVPGGSSSGSASAVACGLVDFALGTDTGGSIRVPASNCGIFGMRPSWGAIPNAGVMPFAPSFDTVGILASTYEILDKVASILINTDKSFDTSIGTIYLVQDAFAISDKEVTEALQQSLKTLRKIYSGAVKEIFLDSIFQENNSPPLHHWLDTFSTQQGAEIWSMHGQWVENAHPAFGPRIQGNFDYIKQIDRTRLGQIIAKRERYFKQMSHFLQGNDLLCFPTTPKIAPLKNSLSNNRYEDDYYEKTLSICSIAGICRLPQISLPLGSVGTVPIGLSLASAYGMDAFLLWAAGQLAKVE